MLRNYLHTAIRSMRRQAGTTFINLFGLAVGIAACAFMLLYIRHELNFDRFHEDADRIYRIATEIKRDGRTEGGAYVHAPVAGRLDDIPGIESISRINSAGRNLIRRDNDAFYVESIASADEHVFDVFEYRLLRGDERTALIEPYSLVVTEALGQRLFGDADPMGNFITLGENEYTVTGILAPIPSATHWSFEGLKSMSTQRAMYGAEMYDRVMSTWFSYQHVYIKVQEEVNPESVVRNVNRLMAEMRPQNVNPSYSLFLQPLTDIHLHSNLNAELSPPGNLDTLRIFGAIAILILLTACINYTNLATARSIRRAREIGVRKIVGASKRQLIGQLLGEAVLTSLVAALFAIVLLELMLPVLSGLVGRPLAVDYTSQPQLLMGIAGLAVIVGLLAGAYPALFLSSSAPVGASNSRPMSVRHGGLRKALVITQFTVSIVFISGTGVIRDQLNYVQTKDLGFDRERIIAIKSSGIDGQRFNAQYATIKQELQRLANVVGVSASMGEPGLYAPDNTFDPDADGKKASVDYNWLATDFGFLDTFGLELVAGRDIDPGRVSDSTDAILVNETAVRALSLDDPIGHRLQLELNNRSGVIVGVVKDFHHASLREEIRPVLMYPTMFYFYSNVFVKVSENDVQATVAAIEQKWKSFFPDTPMEYSFYDDAFDAQYEAERRTARIAEIASLLAVIVACLGLFGLATFAAEQRTKEIGIRKVLGASVGSVMFLLSGNFLKLVCIAVVVATPVAWIAADRWLAGFAYHIDTGEGVFLAAAGIAVVIALITVSGQAARAALSNPVDSLRAE